MINSGWGNNCGVELFTIGWVPCDGGHGGVQKPEYDAETGYKLGLWNGPIEFIGKTQQLDIEVPGIVSSKETASGVQAEIDRHRLALRLMEEKLSLLRDSMMLKTLDAEMDMALAAQFLSELELYIINLLRMKKRRADEEAIMVVLMADSSHH